MRTAKAQALEQQDVWAKHVHDVFQLLKIPPGILADNVSASVAAYCYRFYPDGVQDSDLILLIARAFCAVNERAAAKRVLSSIQPHSRHVERWLEVLSELDRFPELLPYFSQGIIRPADWSGAQLDRMWILDFGRLVVSESDRHEIMLYRFIRAVIDQMYVFWDASKGEGVLGIKGLVSLCIDADKRSVLTPRAESGFLSYIADLFSQEKERRSWCAIPVVLNLDFGKSE